MDCVANKLESKSSQVISEDMLSDAIYPWLEPRIAPLKVNGILRMLNRPKIREKLDEMGPSLHGLGRWVNADHLPGRFA